MKLRYEILVGVFVFTADTACDSVEAATPAAQALANQLDTTVAIINPEASGLGQDHYTLLIIDPQPCTD